MQVRTVKSLIGWLEQRDLKKYAKPLNQHAIDLDVLTELSDTDLKDLGIPLGDRKRFLRAFRDQDCDTENQIFEQAITHHALLTIIGSIVFKQNHRTGEHFPRLGKIDIFQ